jgi:2-polyprenyl-3-methyl-5-hydroxy-6-metoxy-1,4-benzoquinol methylase
MRINPLGWFKRKKNRALWDQQYAEGFWDKILHSPTEEGRYASVRSFIAKYSNGGNILEVGCGDGLLQVKIKEESYSKYIGIDLSQVAIDKAARLQSPKTSYRCADMEDFIPIDQFDLIIFNESIYYSGSPIGLIRKYGKYLNRTGVLIISLTEQHALTAGIMKSIRDQHTVIDYQKTSNDKGISWHCMVITPGHGR